MVLASEILASTASDENSYHPNRNFIHAYSSNSQEAIPLKSNSNKINNKPQRKACSKLLQEKPNWNSRGRSCRNKMQNSATKSNSDETSSGRSLKMRIKKKPGANKSGEKHEIVNNSCETDKSKTNKVKRGRIRIKSGNSSSECDPYEFSAKTDDDELPIKRIKLDAISESPATREVGINAVTLGTMTEPDLLGPCEPGTRICLNGIVWLETDTGLLVINVTWRGRTYVGTLLDSTKHDFAPPCPRDYVSPIESRSYSRGRGKRRGTTFQQSYRNGRGSAKTRGLSRTAPISETTTPTDSEDDSKRNRSRRLSPSSTADSELNSDNYPIECLQQDCSKRFADITALSFHMNQTHIRKQTRTSFISSDGVKSNDPIRPRSLEAPFHFKSKEDFINDTSPTENGTETLVDTKETPAKVEQSGSTNEDRIFKTPSALSLNSASNSTQSSKALSPISPLNGTNQNTTANSTTSDNSTFSFSTVTNSLSINHSNKSLVGNSQSPVPRVVTAHTVTIPMDKSSAPPISPPKKKCDEQKKKKNSTSHPISVPSNKSATNLPSNCQNEVKTNSHLFNSIATSINENSTQPSKSPAINLKPIQPKPKSQNLPSLPEISDTQSKSNNQSERKIKQRKQRSKDSIDKSNTNFLTPNNSSSNSKLNGLSINDHGDKPESYENPASPAYSDISNDSPAPVLEKEVDVKSQVDRSESGHDSEVAVGHRNHGDTAGYLFSQPPSLVPAVVASEKNSVQTVLSDNLETVSKSSLEEKSSPINCLSNDKRNTALDFSKKEPPALTKLTDNKSPANGSSSVSYNNKQGRENTSPNKHCGSEVSNQPRSQASDNKLASQSYSVNNLSRSIESPNIPTPTTSAFNSMTPADISNLSRLYDPHYLHPFNPVHTLSNGLAYNHSMVPSALNSHLKAPSSQHKIHELVEKTSAPSPSSTNATSTTARFTGPLTTMCSGDRGVKSPGDLPMSSHNVRPTHHPLHLVPPLFGHPLHQSSLTFPDSYASSFLLPNGASASTSHSLLFNHK